MYELSVTRLVDADPASPEGQTAQSYLAQLDKP